jgi:hypothetical protein
MPSVLARKTLFLTLTAGIGLLAPISASRAQSAQVDGYECPSGNPFNSLTNGETAQAPGQPRCANKSGGYSDKRCPQGIVTGTTYFVPMEGKESSWKFYTTFFDCLDKGSSLKHTVAGEQLAIVCKPQPAQGATQFSPAGCCKPKPSPGAVNVEGSGFLKDGRVLEYDGKVHPSECEPVFGGPTVKAGGSGKCLIPFIAVACDSKKTYPYGTIFEIQAYKGKTLPMPPGGGQQLKHPGYVICEDTGSAITGEGRFDFFVGTFGENDKLNMLADAGGGGSQLVMDDEHCDKSYRAIKFDDKDWFDAMKELQQATAPGLPNGNFGTWFTGPPPQVVLDRLKKLSAPVDQGLSATDGSLAAAQGAQKAVQCAEAKKTITATDSALTAVSKDIKTSSEVLSKLGSGYGAALQSMNTYATSSMGRLKAQVAKYRSQCR